MDMKTPGRGVVSERPTSDALPFRLPSTESLLSSDGDERIALGEGGTNVYGCPPWPDPALLDFGSSTASVISPEAFEAADRLQARLEGALGAGRGAVELYGEEMQRLRDEFGELCGLDGAGAVDVLFAASGTDLHHILAEFEHARDERGLYVLGAEPAETGSGVPLALAGSKQDTAGGDGGVPIEVASLALRDEGGNPLPSAQVDAAAEAQVGAAIDAGRRVLLVLTDVSKTGLIAPSPACAVALRQRWPEALTVMVDACQFRLAPATLHSYLAQGFNVALTGSKFLGGPTFSGAALIPHVNAARMRGSSLALARYAARAEFPPDWHATAALEDGVRFGLLLRWEAALHEWRSFRELPGEAVADALRELSEIVDSRLQRDPAFAPLAGPRLERSPLSTGGDWDGQATIFPFLLFTPAGKSRRPLNREQTWRIYELLQRDLCDSPEWFEPLGGFAALRCRVGQPVACGRRDGVEVGALRLCFSARLLAEAASGEDGLMRVAGRAMSCLDKCSRLATAIGR